MGELQHPLLRRTVPQTESSAHPEIVRNGIGVEVRVTDDFTQILKSLNEQFGTSLVPRQEGYHITIITPREKETVRTLRQADLDTLKTLYTDVMRGGAARIDGIGYIDGSAREDVLPADKLKKTAYIALTIPEFQAYRRSVGLPEKDFHITLGMEGDDIHTHMVSMPDGSQKTEVIPKKADPLLQRFTPQSMNMGELYVLYSLKPYVTKPII